MRLHIDYETRSKIDLKKSGLAKYAKHPSTEILCLGYKLGDAKTEIWVPDFEPIPKKLFNALNDKDTKVVAHNAQFERNISRYVLPRYAKNLREIETSRYTCTAAKAATHYLPRSLEDAGAALGLPVKKDKEGKRVMLKLSKPRKATKNNSDEFHSDTDDLVKLYKYCATDVEVEALIDKKLLDLIPSEQALWELDQKINDRGIRVDRELLDKSLEALAELSERYKAQIQEVTRGHITTPNQRDKILNYLRGLGCELENLQAKTVRDALKLKAMHPLARAILEIRDAAASSSVKKYNAFKNRIEDDDRVRDNLLFFGGHTGRWAGVGIQPQNFPRGINGLDTDQAVKDFKEGGLSAIEALYGEPMKVFASLLRGLIIASPGKELLCADFAAIEARVLFWLAKYDDGIEAFLKGRDLYKEMAMVIYGLKRIEDVTKPQRELGKRAILGCFEADTMVLTRRGWKAITTVQLDDKLWDGVEWVNHSGLIYQGEKETVNLCGVKLTPDHLVLSRQGWTQASEVLKGGEQSLNSILNLVSLPLSGIGSASVAGSCPFKSSVAAGGRLIKLTPKISLSENLRGAILALKKQLTIGKKNIDHTPILCPRTSPVAVYLTAFRRLCQGVTHLPQKCFTIMVDGGLKFLSPGEKIAVYFLNTLRLYPVGITQNSKWIESITKRAMSRAICVLFRNPITQKIKDELAECKSLSMNLRKKSHVYDLLEAGPRNRFVIATSKGPILVHNCGYGMGHKKFYETCLQFDMEVTEELSKKAIKAYRTTHAHVPSLWSNTERAAIAAVKTKKAVTANRVTWFVKGDFLYARLPSGRCLAYYGPKIVSVETPWGHNDQLKHWAPNPKTKQWEFVHTYGGKLVENLCQSVARDLMSEAMVRIENAGAELLLTVHDEILAESEAGKFSVKEFEELMAKLPDWAKGCPVKAEGWAGARYKK